MSYEGVCVMRRGPKSYLKICEKKIGKNREKNKAYGANQEF
jgi:hypothetical protein